MHRTCEMATNQVPCDQQATRYGGYSGAGEWAGYTCEMHAGELDWTERLR